MNIIDKYFYNWWEMLVNWAVRKLLRDFNSNRSWPEETKLKRSFKFVQHLKKHNFTKRRNTLRSLSGGATSMPYLMNWDGMLRRGGLREQQMLHRMEIERQQNTLRQMERSSELYLAMLEQRRLMDSYNGPSKSF
jgi:hypothetical protein